MSATKKKLRTEELEDLLKVISQAKIMWESTFDAIRDPVLIINKGYVIERANLAAADAASVKITKIIGQKCYEVLAKRNSPCSGCPLPQTLLGKPSSKTIENFLEGRDYQISSYPLQAQVIHHYRDVTEERRLQKRIVQNEKMAAIGMLAGGVAHEINNPLAGILAFTQILRHSLPETNVAQPDLKEIEEAAKRCKKIVEDLLLFARTPLTEDLHPVDLVETIERLLPLLRLQLQQSSPKKVEIETFYQSPLHLVMGSSPRLQQVFLNLIQNAAQSMEEGGKIEIRVLMSSAIPTDIMVEIQDEGCGIKKEHLPKIFDPFFTTKRVGEGTGLGLSISYSIVQDHRGRIEVKSLPGRGSLFRVLLPTLPLQTHQKGTPHELE